MIDKVVRWTAGVFVAAVFVVLAGIQPVHAQVQTKDFNVLAQPATTGIPEFARQAGIQILVSEPLVRDKRVAAVSGTHSIGEALGILLKGTGLVATTRDGATYTLALASSIPKAQKEGASRFDIPAEALDQALNDFGAQSGVIVNDPSALVAGKKSSIVQGSMTAAEALGRLLKGSGLLFDREADGSVSIHGKQEQSAMGPSTAQGGSEQRAEDRTGLAEILVKGSRIMNVDVTRTEDDAQPYYILDATQIEQSGAVDVEDFLKQRLTMNTTFSTNSQVYAGGLTTSSIDLRGLGPTETLILIDGRRSATPALLGYSSPTQPDINGIPLAAIERIEILPGSASAIYGGAAMGGVVNVILKKNFNGGEAAYTYDNTLNASSPRRTVNGTYGFSLQDGKTRVMLSGHYSDGEPLTLEDRLNLVQRGISTILANSPSYFYNASNPFPGATPNIACQDVNGNPTNCVLKNGTSLNSPITSIPAGAAPGSNLSAGLLANAGKYNLNLAPGTAQYGLQSQFGTVPTTKSAMATLRHEFTDRLEAFAELSTVSNSGNQLVNPFGGNFTVPASAPTNPFKQNVTMTIPTATSPLTTSDSVTQSATIGFIAHFAGDWHSELDYTWSQNSSTLSQQSYDFTVFPAALAAGTVNPFVDTLAYPLKLTPYLGIYYTAGTSTLNDLAVRASGPIASLPWGQPTLTIGLEHRKEGYDDSPNEIIFPSDPAGSYPGLFFRGQSQSTDSAYAEALVPLVTENNVLPGIHSLQLQLAGRSEHYIVYANPDEYFTPQSPFYGMGLDSPGSPKTIQYTSTNPTIAVKYQPVREVTVRASYATAFLPPTPVQLLPDPTVYPSPQLITDPRNGEVYNVNYTQGGNPDLQPQKSKTWDVGLIWEPQALALQGLRLNFEYYKITQPNYITTPTLQQIVDDPAFASRVTRNPTTGRITLIDDSSANAIDYWTNGWDLSVDYRKPTAAGTFALHTVGTMVEHDLRQYTIGSPALEYAGFPASGGETKLKANASVSFEHKQWTFAWTTTYFGSYQQLGAPNEPNPGGGTDGNAYITAAQGSSSVPSQIYHDIYASYVFDKTPAGRGYEMGNRLLSGLIIQFGVKNVFNTVPPFDAAAGPYFYSPLGDPRLRTYRLSVRKSF